jgi:sulfite oxidase
MGGPPDGTDRAGSVRSHHVSARWGKRADMVVHEAEPYNAEPPPEALAGAPRTPVDTFYTRNHGPVPDIDETSWQLRVDGMVEHELQLSLADLHRDFETHEIEATMQCAGNRRAGFLEVRDIPGEDPWGPAATATATWTGVRLADVLASAVLRSGPAHVAFAAPDRSELADPPQNFGASIPLGKACHPEVLLAWAMNGAPLTPVHGAPLRVVVPGYIGARSVKWVDRITVQDVPSDNYFQAVAYRLLPADADPATADPADGLSLGSVALNCEVLRPADGADVPVGAFEATGYAYAGDDRTVARVDVSVDAGRSWRQARVDAPASPWTWQHWHATVDLPRGRTTIVVRTWDSTGAAQPESAAHLWNPKGYLNNSWARSTVTAS